SLGRSRSTTFSGTASARLRSRVRPRSSRSRPPRAASRRVRVRVARVSGGDWMELEEPRVPPGKGRQLGLFARAMVPVIRRQSKGRTVNIFATLGRNKRFFRPWLMFAARLMPRGTLPREETELVILRTSINCRARYEWEQHQSLARRAGLSDADVERVREGPGAEGWSERQAAILAAV